VTVQVEDLHAELRELERRRRRSNRIVWRLVGYIPPIVLLALGVLAWQVIATIKNVPDYLLPKPSLIWQTTIDERDLLLTNTWPTLRIVVFGFLISLSLGVVLAIAINYSTLLERAVYPIIIASQTIPLIALAPILVVLLGFTITPKLIVVFLICFFPIVVNTVDGFKSVDPDQINLLRTLGAGRWRLFRDVQFPTALPYLFSGTKVAATFSVIGAVFGELVGSDEGLAHLMIQKEAQLDTAALFSAMLILSLMGIMMFVAVAIAERLLMPWYHTEKKRNALSR
jgi:ABC-type nitrate/sulfonate/bicarbonate transport system permease component